MRQAAILCGGQGTRLGATVPKCLVPVAGQSVLQRQLAQLEQQGFDEVVLLTGHGATEVEAAAKTGMRVICNREMSQLGTAGALFNAKSRLEEAFLLLNGDTLVEMSYSLLESDMCCMAVAVQSPRNAVTEGPLITAFGAGGGDAAFAGAVWLHKTVIDLVRYFPSWLEHAVFPQLAREGKLQCYHIPRFWDIGTPERLAAAEAYFAH